MDTLDERELRDSTVVILSADHGGAGKSHGPNDPRSRHIPWIACGPGIRGNYDLTLDATLTVDTEDTFSTACFFLGLRPIVKPDGRPVQQVLEDRELMHDAKPPATAGPTAAGGKKEKEEKGEAAAEAATGAESAEVPVGTPGSAAR